MVSATPPKRRTAIVDPQGSRRRQRKHGWLILKAMDRGSFPKRGRGQIDRAGGRRSGSGRRIAAPWLHVHLLICSDQGLHLSRSRFGIAEFDSPDQRLVKG